MWNRSGIPTLYLLIVFACGLAVGCFGYRYLQLREVVASNPPLRSPAEWKKRHLNELQDRLHLTADQTSKISTILDESRGEYDALMEKNRPEMDQIQNRQYAKVKAILNPGQFEVWEKLRAERRRRGGDRRKF